MRVDEDHKKANENQRQLVSLCITESQCLRGALSFQIAGTQLKKIAEGQRGSAAFDLSQSATIHECFELHQIENFPEHFTGILSITPPESEGAHATELKRPLKTFEQGQKHQVVASGQFRAAIQPVFECVRCLSEFRRRIDIEESFRLVKHSKEKDFSRELESEQEIESETLDTFTLEHGRIHLDLIIRDFIEASLPDYPVCDPNCHGLCPSCGRNLNEPTDCARKDCSLVKML